MKVYFPEGTRVRAIKDSLNRNATGKIGTVMGQYGRTILVEFDEDVGGHSGPRNLTGRDGHCLWWLPEELEMIKEVTTNERD